MKRLLVPALVFSAVAAASCAVSGTQGAAASPAPAAGDPAKGKAVYDYWCATCHGRGPGHPGTQSLEIKYKGKDVPAALEDRTDLAPAVTAYFVRRGYALMPPFRKTEIGDAQLRDLEAYLARKR